MKIINKTIASLIAMFLMLTIVASSIMPIANAHTPPWKVPTSAYIVLAPNPIGVGQQVFVVFWIEWIPVAATGITGDRWQNLKIYVTKPDGSQETLGPFLSDPIGGSFTFYTPTQVGTYKFNFSFPEQVAHNYHPVTGLVGGTTNEAYANDTFLASSTEKTLVVQQDPISDPPSFPLPTEYWARPIEGQNTDWYKVASNWLGGGMQVHKNFQPNGIAPNSSHVMWTKPLRDGGVVGGTYELDGVTYYTGDSYEVVFQESIVINGRLYYRVPLNHQAGNGGLMCVDLRTGEEIWTSNTIGASSSSPAPTYGQIYHYDSFNQHGVINGLLWQVIGTTWVAYDAVSGMWVYNMTNVPSGFTEYGPNGEILRYVLNYAGRSLALWNNTAEQQGLHGALGYGTSAYQWRPAGKQVNMNNAYSWNVSIPNLPGSASPAIQYVIADDLMLGSSTTFSTSYPQGTPDPYTMWAISLKPESRGQLLWIKNYPAPTGNTTVHVQTALADGESRVWLTYDVNAMTWNGYSMDNGEKLWGPIRVPGNDWDYHSRASGGYPSHAGIGEARTIAYGNLYLAGFSGLINCIDMETGEVLWTYGNGGSGNSTYMGLAGPWGNYPNFISKIADGKVYTFTSEHSTGQPIYKGSQWRCIDAFTGEEKWTMYGYSERNMGVIADGYFVNLNAYDSQIYCIGKGPSKLTVTAPDAGIELGNSIVIKGTVTDVASGTQQNEQIARFPNGVPAVSEDSMSSWMEYVYMQKPRPTNATGVEVTLSVLDANNNLREIGKATTDSDGFYTLNWKPDIEGPYTLYASFAGSESYWPSHAVSSFAVDPAPQATTTQQPNTAAPQTEMYILIGVAAIIVAIAIGFAVTINILKKRP